MQTMIRTQVQLTDEQAAGLRRLAAERGVSLAALVREAVGRLLSDSELDERKDRALRAVGIGASGIKHRSIAEDHDEFLADDFLD